MATVPYCIYGGQIPHSNGEFSQHFGFFVKPGGTPGGTTTLVDYDGGSNLSARVYLSTGMAVIFEISYHGAYSSLDLTAADTLSAGVWYWVAVVTASYGGNNSDLIGIRGRVYGPGGAGAGEQSLYPTSGPGGDQIVNCTLGIGKSLTSGYADFPNTAGWRMSKFLQYHLADSANNAIAWPFNTPMSPPTSDPSPSGYDVFYDAQQTVGAQATLVDATIDNYDASGAFTLYGDGPY